MAALETDPALARSLAVRLQGTNVHAIEGDGTNIPFRDGSFSTAVSFTMLHHVPSPAAQDRLLEEVHRVLRPGGLFVGTGSRWSRGLQWMHYRDTFVPVDPTTLGERLARAGFTDVRIELQSCAFPFPGYQRMIIARFLGINSSLRCLQWL